MLIANISPFILNFDSKKLLSSLGLEPKLTSKQREKKLCHRGHGQKLYENKQGWRRNLKLDRQVEY